MLGLVPLNRNLLQRKNHLDLMEFNNIFDDFFDLAPFSSRALKNATFKLDVADKDGNFIVEAELPGLPKEAVKVDYQDGYLVISVNREEEINEDKERYIHRERRVCSMQRSLYLNDVDENAIDARMENGILTVTLPKVEPKAKKAAIEIK